MAWIAAAIGAVGSVAASSIQADAKKSAAGGFALPSNSFADSSMNNSGFVVTTSGSVAKVTANTDSTKTPQLGQTTPIVMPGAGGGLDMTTIIIIAGLLLLVKKKG